MAPIFSLMLMLTLLSNVLSQADRYENCSCSPTITDTSGNAWTFDLTGLYRPQGHVFPRTDLQWNITSQICGDSPFVCADGITQYVSVAAATQVFGGAPQAGDCAIWDPPFGRVTPCSSRCVPIALAGSGRITAADRNNVSTGGLVISFLSVPDSPADTYTCQPDPNRPGVDLLRTFTMNLQCDTSSSDRSSIVWGQATEPSQCVYVVNGSTPAACGMLVLPTPSPTATATATGTATSSSTASPSASMTSVSTATSTASATPSRSAQADANALIDGVYSPLDRDVGIGTLGAVLGAVCLSACIVAGHRRMLPWQWYEDHMGQGDGKGGGRSRRRSAFLERTTLLQATGGRDSLSPYEAAEGPHRWVEPQQRFATGTGAAQGGSARGRQGFQATATEEAFGRSADMPNGAEYGYDTGADGEGSMRGRQGGRPTSPPPSAAASARAPAAAGTGSLARAMSPASLLNPERNRITAAGVAYGTL